MLSKELLVLSLSFLALPALGYDAIHLSTINSNSDDNGRSHPSRLDVVINNGQITRKEVSILGESFENYKNTDYKNYLIAPHYFAMMPAGIFVFDPKVAKTARITGHNQLSIDISSDNTDKRLTYKLRFTDLDISNIKLTNKDYRFYIGDFKLNKSTFPTGSRCILLSGSYPSFEYFEFSSDDWQMMPNLHHIEEALINLQNFSFIQDDSDLKPLDLNSFIDLHIVNVGDNNQYRAAYFKTNEEDKFYNALVEYDNQVYDASYIESKSQTTNTDPSKGVVECDFLNDIAINYLESEIKKYGTLK